MVHPSNSARTFIYLVRHADAGIRSDQPDDHARPLSVRGWEQARGVADLLESTAVGDILSSPFVRCVRTVEPLADRRGCQVAPTDALAEGAEIEPLLHLLERVPAHSVLCTHGDILRGVMDVVTLAELPRGQSDCFHKGVVWVLARDEDGFSLVDVIPPGVPRSTLGKTEGRNTPEMTSASISSGDLAGSAT